MIADPQSIGEGAGTSAGPFLLVVIASPAQDLGVLPTHNHGLHATDTACCDIANSVNR